MMILFSPDAAPRPQGRLPRLPALLLLLLALPHAHPTVRASGQGSGPRHSTATARQPELDPRGGGIPAETLLKIVRAEDERRWDKAELGVLLASKSAPVRRRAALAAGRIGDEGAVQPLGSLLRTDADERVRSTAAFALGEIESATGADVLLTCLRLSKSPVERARAVEALGKIAGALPQAQDERRKALGAAILSALEAEGKSARPNGTFLLLGLTAALRARPEGAAPVVGAFLSSPNARVRADALNTLARLRAKESPDKVRLLLAGDPDPVVRANAARALGAAEDAQSLDTLLAKATGDPDPRVRVSAVRALAQLKDARAAEPLVGRAQALFAPFKVADGAAISRPAEANELLEVATTLGRLLQNTGHERAIELLRQFRVEGLSDPEIEVALARISTTQYMRDPRVTSMAERNSGRGASSSWQAYSALAQGLGEIAAASSEAGGNSVVSLKADAQIILLTLLGEPSTPPLALPDVMRALAAFKPANLSEQMRAKFSAEDVVVRSTAADLLAELDPDPANARALVTALPRALSDKINDAALSVLAALAKQKTPEATEAIRTALEAPDHSVRLRAAALLKELGAGGPVVETVATRSREAVYVRALGRVGRTMRARVETAKGAFTIELLPSEAPLNVDNFVELARRGFFNNVAFHRVVPNFVVQGGDPRGDGNGGPGYQIRCEINAVPYDRGAVGMALSGKDTGGSQWFVTHSPQPHLDGGYTVFGGVVEGMDVIDRIARGDRINAVTITEGKQPAVGGRRPTGPRR